MVPLRSHLAFAQFPLTIALGLTLTFALPLANPSPPSTAPTHSVIHTWLDSQTNLHTWSADVVQTRTLQSLVQPLTTTGRVWFAAPNQFRWELGDPPQTIAIRQPDRMLIIYPRLNRVEQFPLDDDSHGPWRDALALIEAGFPRSAAELTSRFRLLGVESSSHLHHILLQPITLSARRLMPRISVFLNPDPLALQATEIEFADSSSIRNEFTNANRNPLLDPALFNPPLDPNWKIIHPNP